MVELPVDPSDWVPVIAAVGTAVTSVLAALTLLLLRVLARDVNGILAKRIESARAEGYAAGGADERERATGEKKPATLRRHPPK